jgi:hypothetical protein
MLAPQGYAPKGMTKKTASPKALNQSGRYWLLDHFHVSSILEVGLTVSYTATISA